MMLTYRRFESDVIRTIASFAFLSSIPTTLATGLKSRSVCGGESTRGHAAINRILEVQLSNIRFEPAGKSCFGGRGPQSSADTNNVCTYGKGGDMSFAFSSGEDICRDVLVFRQTAGEYLAKDEWKNKNSDDPNNDNYSILDQLEGFRDASGKFEFMITWPQNENPTSNRWTQTSNPLDSKIDGYFSIDTPNTARNWGGLEYNTGPQSLIDGSVKHDDWFYAIGSTRAWDKGIPGAGSAETRTELYVRTCSADSAVAAGYISEWDPRTESNGRDLSGAPFAIGNTVKLFESPVDTACWKLLEVHSFTEEESKQQSGTISLIFGTELFDMEECKDISNFEINTALSGQWQMYLMVNFCILHIAWVRGLLGCAVTLSSVIGGAHQSYSLSFSRRQSFYCYFMLNAPNIPLNRSPCASKFCYRRNRRWWFRFD